MTTPFFTLAVETAQQPGSVALLEGARVIAERVFVDAPRGGGSLSPAVAELLALAPERRIDLVATALGPGSFTGARIGLAYATFFAFGRGLPLIGVCDLAALALVEAAPGERVAPGVVAHDGAIFGAVYEGVRDDEPTPLRPPAVQSADEFRAAASAAGARVVVAPPARITASAIGLVAVRRFARTRIGDDPARLEPLYLRAASPER
jgi:tRNA threonylcarbamoyl adenosine modification protein YeaZ